MVRPYRIQQDALIPVPDDYLPLKTTVRPKRMPLDSAALFPDFSSAMPMLKEMLVQSRRSQAKVQ
jgi:hypothetical protein